MSYQIIPDNHIPSGMFGERMMGRKQKYIGFYDN